MQTSTQQSLGSDDFTGGKSRELNQMCSTCEQIHEMTPSKKKFKMPEHCDSSF